MTDTDTPLLAYSGGFLDRANDKRNDDAWLHARLHSLDTRVIPVWRGQVLVMNSEYGASAVTLTGTHARGLLQIAGDVIFLGVGEDDTAYFAADASHHERPVLTPIMGPSTFVDLRDVGSVLSAFDANILAQARGYVHWHACEQHCGLCGTKTELKDGGAHRACTDDACGKEFFPRTDPAVIMLVTRPGPDGGACLLARHPVWPNGLYATLAGFVEPGESLEDAVAREVKEEVGLELGAIEYKTSQPWPFPSSIMVGYRATAKTVRMTVDPSEIEDARWFTRKQIAEFDEIGLQLPREDTLSRKLIEDWLIS